MLRYGLIFILFYIVLQTMICKKSNNKLAFVFLITTIASSIDNDLFSYGFFPYIIIAFSGKEPMVDNIKTYISKNNKSYVKIKNCKIDYNRFVNYSDKYAIFIKPIFKCKVEYLERTNNNHLRQPILKNIE